MHFPSEDILGQDSAESMFLWEAIIHLVIFKAFFETGYHKSLFAEYSVIKWGKYFHFSFCVCCVYNEHILAMNKGLPRITLFQKWEGTLKSILSNLLILGKLRLQRQKVT